MSSLNKVMLIGSLGRDPETRETQAGNTICHLSVATSERWKDKAGEKQERTEWHRVVIFNEGIAKIAAQYLRKGSKVYLEGQLQTRKWTDKEGVERYTTEITMPAYRGQLVLLDGAKHDDGPREERPAARGKAADLDDDIPF